MRAAVHIGHDEVVEIVASNHCIERYGQRMPVDEPSVEQIEAALRETLEDADVTRWPPAWAVSDRPVHLWAVSGDLAFPLAETPTRGRWLAVTCLRR